MELDLKKIYAHRFEADLAFRKKMWEILCTDFFQKYIPPNAHVLEVAAGYCEFINHIKCEKKTALDLNPDIKKFANSDVKTILSTSTNMDQVPDSSCDVVFVSNFFEHLSKPDIAKTIREIFRVLKVNGRFLVLQPNIRLCVKDYWSFFDHITPLDDKSLSEILEVTGFKIVETKLRFLPFTMKSKLPKSTFLIRWYLKLPLAQFIFGKQTFIYAQK
ncbi:MAG: class I SAM-dependent methyltransferase [Candidatus Omnitrophica bacterium]|nr:class I SAM-dependent methyltransferase [Candidatus Omnitrophota bacterium]